MIGFSGKAAILGPEKKKKGQREDKIITKRKNHFENISTTSFVKQWLDLTVQLPRYLIFYLTQSQLLNDSGHGVIEKLPKILRKFYHISYLLIG